MRLALITVALLCWVCAAQTSPPHLAAGDLAEGKRLFLSNCAPCHGPTGNGGKGSDLTRARLPRAPDDQAFFNVIRKGIPGTEMPNTRHLTDSDIWRVIAYARSLAQTVPQKIPGDPSHGVQLYINKGHCPQCHMIHGQGGRLGPDLADAGLRRSPGYLRNVLVNPRARVLDSFFLYRPAGYLTADLPTNFLQVRVVTRDGRHITGVRLNEDPFSIQLRDFSDRFYSFWKDELAELHEDWGQSPMPDYRGVFTPAELNDLVAYLASLRGSPSRGNP